MECNFLFLLASVWSMLTYWYEDPIMSNNRISRVFNHLVFLGFVRVKNQHKLVYPPLLSKESRSYLSVVDHPLRPGIDLCLCELLPIQLANQTRALPRADSLFWSSTYEVLVVVSRCFSPPKGMFLRVTHPFTTWSTTCRSTCMFKACH